MKSIRLLLLSLFILPTFDSFSQTSADPDAIGYIRIRLNDLTTPEQEVLVDQFMRSKPGVLMSRTDRNTDVFFAHYSLSSGLTESDFVAWIQSVGFQTGCVVSGVRNGEPMKALPAECPDPVIEGMTRTN